MDIGDGIIGGILGLIGGERRNDQAEDAANAQMAFQERMSSTAHQREVQDLKNAGLNPMLSALKGAGATTPAGALATVENSMAAGVNTGLAAAMNKATVDKLRAETLKAVEETRESASRQRVNNATIQRTVEADMPEILSRVPLHAASAAERRGALSVHDQQVPLMQSQADRNFELNRLTRAQTAVSREEQALKNLQLLYSIMDWPEKHSRHEAWKSWLGANVMPYSRTFQELGSSASGFARGLFPFLNRRR